MQQETCLFIDNMSQGALIKVAGGELMYIKVKEKGL